MLSFCDGGGRMGRRAFLRVGGVGWAASLLTGPWSGSARAAASVRPVTDKSVILLFLHGGPSQIETFDPKMSAPAGIRSVTDEVATSVPGVTFGGSFPRLAALAHRLAIVRSYRPGNASHDIKPVVCRETLDANLGSIYARIAGTNHPVNGIPLNTALFPRAVDPETQAAVEQFGKFWSTGMLGAAYAPFMPGGGGQLQDDMVLQLPRDRLDDRRALLTQLDRWKRALDADQQAVGLERLREQAFDVILGGVAEAFDLAQEDPRTVARYDTAPLVRPDQISRSWNNYPRYVDNAKTLGKLLLLARRLCEAGCGFVTVTTNFVWDMHADRNNAGLHEGMRYTGGPLDHALSAFLEDVEARGLSEKILLVAVGEIGRTPKVNARGGRDHWGSLAPLVLAGGGLRMGQVVGESSPDAGEPHDTPVAISNLIGTVMHTLLDVTRLRVTDGVPADLLRLVGDAAPIPGLV